MQQTTPPSSKQPEFEVTVHPTSQLVQPTTQPEVSTKYSEAQLKEHPELEKMYPGAKLEPSMQQQFPPEKLAVSPEDRQYIPELQQKTYESTTAAPKATMVTSQVAYEHPSEVKQYLPEVTSEAQQKYAAEKIAVSPEEVKAIPELQHKMPTGGATVISGTTQPIPAHIKPTQVTTMVTYETTEPVALESTQKVATTQPPTVSSEGVATFPEAHIAEKPVEHHVEKPAHVEPLAEPYVVEKPAYVEPPAEQHVVESTHVAHPPEHHIEKPIHVEHHVEGPAHKPFMLQGMSLKEHALKMWPSIFGTRWNNSVVNNYHGARWSIAVIKEMIKHHALGMEKNTSIHAYAQKPSGEVFERNFGPNASHSWEENAAKLSPQVNDWVAEVSGNNPKLA